MDDKIKNKSNNSNTSNTSIDNLYRLDGRVSIQQAVPFGLQHILAMLDRKSVV